jgi:transposase-like protein
VIKNRGRRGVDPWCADLVAQRQPAAPAGAELGRGSRAGRGHRPAGAAARSSDSEEVKALRKRVAELERANDILRTSAAFLAQVELDRRFK